MASKILTVLFSFFLLTGCATAGANSEATAAKSEQDATKAEAQKLYTRGLMSMNHGNLDKAAQYFVEAIKLYPGSYKARMILTDVYLRTNKSSLALEQAKEAVKLDPKEPMAYFKIMKAYLKMDLPKHAAETGEEAIKAGVPADVVAGDLGWSYYLADDPVQAEKYMKMAVGQKLDTAPYNNIGILYFSLGRYEEALASFQEAGKLNPASKLVPYFTALALNKLGKEDEAVQSLKEAISKDPELEKSLPVYKSEFFPRTDTGDLTALIEKAKAVN